MDPKKLAELKAKLATALKGARDIAAKAEEEDRDFTAEERDQVKAFMKEAKDLKDKITQADGDAALRKSIATLGEDFDFGLASDTEQRAYGRAGRGKSLGEQFWTSPEYTNWLKTVAPNGVIPDKAKGLISPTVGFKTLLTGASDTSAGAMVFNDVKDIFVELGRRPLTLRDVITNGKTSSDTVEYVRVTSETNNAAPVAEATATGGSSGVKPESGMALVKVTENVKTIAHWLPVTKRALSDAGQLRTLIDQFLRYGLEEELEDQMISGDGTGENFTGLANVSGTQSQAYDTDLLTTTRKARRKVRTVGRAIPNAYLLHPEDWEKLDLLKDAENRYYFGGPMRLGTPMLWGLPVIECEALTIGEGYVGDFRRMVLWDREQASITVSDSHSDFFIRNMVAILAEMRAAFGILKPNAFVEIDLTP